MKKTFSYLMVLFAVILLAQAASSTTINNDGYTKYAQGIRYGHNITWTNATLAPQQVGQSFNISCTGTYSISQISVKFNKTSTNDNIKVRVTLYNASSNATTSAFPIQPVLDYSEMSTAGLNGYRRQFNFTSNYQYTCNKAYVFTLTSDDPNTLYVASYRGTSNAYSNGVPLLNLEDAGNHWIVISDGYDFDFNITYSQDSLIANESVGRTAIISGISGSSASSGSVSYDKQLVLRLLNGTQVNATLDVYWSSGNQRWAFNYDQNTTANFPTIYNITSTFYTWQAYNMSNTSIIASISAYINSTYT